MLLLFFIVSLISFAGSVHPGPVNMAVVQMTLSQNRRAGLWLALGGSLPEIAYSALAAGGLMLIPTDSRWWVVLMYAPIPVLLGAGIASFRQKPVVLNQSTASGTSFPFWKGALLAATNPQLLPFWSAVWLYLSSHKLVPVGYAASQWVFALGTSAGAFALLMSVALLANWQRQRIVYYLNGRWINRLTGIAFIGMALWQAVLLLIN
ncbi:LysE family translocator [uncultured Fibrella sp.]|uniref:LysE family translocator n=1 Tax=uncultured Fibrella sp. TaxID=1284596 RepID=UPI0035CB608A